MDHDDGGPVVGSEANETRTADAARWAEAEARAAGRAETVSGGFRGGWSPSRRPVLHVAAAIVVMVGVGVVLDVMVGGGSDDAGGSAVARWREVVGLVMIVVGVGIIVVTLVRARRTAASGWGSPLRVLSSAQQRRVGRQLRGKAPVAEDEVAVLRSVAEVIRVQSKYLQPLMVGLAVSTVGQIVQSTSNVVIGSSAIALVVVGSALVLLLRSAPRMQSFLDDHPGPTPVGGV